MSFTVLLLYTSTVEITKTVIVQAPDLTYYNQLYEEHAQTLTYPCRKTSMNYGTFLQIRFSLHPVCKSVHVSDEFISIIARLSRTNTSTRYNTDRSDDFRITGPSIFQAMRSLCQLAQDAISVNMEQFNVSNHVSISATSPELFRSESDALVQQFISSTTKTFLLSIRLIRNTTQANALLSALFTNYRLFLWRRTPQLHV